MRRPKFFVEFSSVCAILFSGYGASAIAQTDTSAATRSSVSAAVAFPLPALESALDDLIPRRLASFDDHGSECWHRYFFGRDFRVDCDYEGYIERTGGIQLSTENGRIVGEMPVFGSVSARGIGRFVRRLHGSTEAQLTVYASARPRLLPDWNVALDMHEGFRWREPPIVRVLGFPIDLARYAEPSIEQQLARVKERVEENVRSLDVRGKAERVWQQLSTPVQLSDSPGVWLQVTPQDVAFSGLRATGRELEGMLRISGTAQAVIGDAPAPAPATPLPALGSDVSDAGEFNVAIPLDLPFSDLTSRWQQSLAADPQFGGGVLKSVKLSASDGKLVMTFDLADGQGGAKSVTLTAEPKAGADGQSIELEGLTPGGSLDVPLNLDAVTGLHDSLSVAFKDRFDALMSSANTRLNKQLGDGFRREGHLDIGQPINVTVLPDRLRVTATAHGNLGFVYDR